MALDAAFPYGASYSPLIYPEAEWENDLRQMQAAGMNIVRIGDVHGSWDRIEPQKGRFQFELLGRFYTSAAHYGVHALLSTGAACPPLWLAHEYPDVRILSSRGEAYPLAASYHWACIHHPGFLEESDRYLEALAQFAVRQENHFGWQITNEIGFPFLPTRARGELDLFCYCQHCKARFREWVQDKYQTLEALNEAWMWGTTGFWHNDWGEVEPPEALPNAWSGMTRWIDWRLFWQHAFARFARHQHEVIRQDDADSPTSINTFNFKGYDRFGTFTGLDQWQIAEQVDHIGYDLYPGSGDKLATRPEHNSMFLDHGRSVSQAVGTDYWLHEIESGPIGGWIMGPDYNTGPRDIWRNGLEALGHDTKLVIYMPWREWDYQPLHWGALVDLDGQPTERLEAAAGLGQYIRANHEFLRAAHVPRGEVALLESKPNAIFFRGVDQEEVLFAAQRGAYRALWEMDFQVDFVTPAQLSDPALNDYRVIALPLVGAMSLETAEALRQYVENGGLLVGFARCATVDQRGWYHRQLPVPGLREVFGLNKVEPDAQREPAIQFNGQTYQGSLNRDLMTPAETTEVLAAFDDGGPAVTLARYGEGYGLYVGTQADSGYLQTEGGLLRAVLASVLDRLAIRPRLSIAYDGKVIRELDPHLLETDSRTTIIITNYLKHDTTAVLRTALSGRTVNQVRGGIGITERQAAQWSQDGDHLTLDLSLEKEAGEIIDIYWQS